MLDKMFEIAEQPYTEADAEWDSFVQNHPHGSLLQTTQWAKLKGKFGWNSRRVWLKQQGKLVAGGQILFKSAAFGLARIGYMPHGPLVNWQDEEQVAVLFNQIDQAMYLQRAGILKIEPMLWQDETPEWETWCQRIGLRPHTDTIQPPRTVLLDLRPSEADILAAMKQKTRYNIRLADKKEITVREGTVKDLPTFYGLMRQTGERDTFGIHDRMYYQEAYQLFAPQQAALFMAEYGERPLAGVMVFALGAQAAYLYGASSNEERQRMPSYAAQWAAIQWAKNKGCTSYDMWGIPDLPEDVLEAGFTEQKGGLWRVYRFKRGFGGQIRRTVGPADRVYNRFLYWLYQRRRNTSE